MSVLEALAKLAGKAAPDARAILAEADHGARTYEIPTSLYTNAWMEIAQHPLAALASDVTGATLPNAAWQFSKVLPKVHSVNWHGGFDVPEDPRAQARYGLEAMRGVIDGLKADAGKYRPRAYWFTGATPAHDKLYASLFPQMRRAGYTPLRFTESESGRDGVLMLRTAPTNTERVVSDLAMTAPIGGALGAIMARSGQPAGMLAPGNIDLHHRPVVHKPDGSISTVRSISIEADGKHYLIPTVSDDGRILSNADAVQAFQRSGRHLGQFADDAAADAYAQQLHNEQAREYEGRR